MAYSLYGPMRHVYVPFATSITAIVDQTNVKFKFIVRSYIKKNKFVFIENRLVLQKSAEK